MANSTNTDVTFGGALCNGVAAKQEDFHYTAPSDKQIKMLQPTTPFRDLINFRSLTVLFTLTCV